MTENVSFVQPYWEQVTPWERKWQSPSALGSGLVATLGPRPGNTNKPPPNNYKVLKWVKAPNKKIDLDDTEFLPKSVNTTSQDVPVSAKEPVKQATSPVKVEVSARPDASPVKQDVLSPSKPALISTESHSLVPTIAEPDNQQAPGGEEEPMNIDEPSQDTSEVTNSAPTDSTPQTSAQPSSTS